MAQVIVTESSLENIAGAIRAKLGTQATYKPAQMAGAIAQIHGDPVLEALNVNANGTYTPSSGKDGFSQVVVNVPNSYTSGDEGKVVSNGALVVQSSQSISANGSYDTTLKNQVNVNVPNSYSASDEGKVVDNGALVAQSSQTITNNGTYDTTLKNQVVVNVSGGGGGSKNILGGATAPTSADGTDGDIYIKYTDYSDFPSGYTPLEYLGVDNTSGPYIDTGIAQTSTSYFEIDANWTSSPSNNNALFGCGRGGYNEYLIQCWNVPYICAGTAHITIPNPLTRHSYKANSYGIYIDNEVVSTSVAWQTFGLNYSLFAMNWDNVIYRASKARIYGCKIWDDTTLVRHFIPAKRNSDDALGMYDLVNDVFYTNSGTGTFIGGTELTGKPIDAAYLKVSGAWIPLEDGDWDDVNTGE